MIRSCDMPTQITPYLYPFLLDFVSTNKPQQHLMNQPLQQFAIDALQATNAPNVIKLKNTLFKPHKLILRNTRCTSMSTPIALVYHERVRKKQGCCNDIGWMIPIGQKLFIQRAFPSVRQSQKIKMTETIYSDPTLRQASSTIHQQPCFSVCVDDASIITSVVHKCPSLSRS